MEDKYWQVFKLEFLRMQEYKFDLYGRFVRLVVMFFFTAVLWYVLFDITGAATLADLDLATFTLYAVLSRAIYTSMAPWHTVDLLELRVISGELTGLITKPLHMLKYFFMKGIFYYITIAVLSITTVIIINFAAAPFIPGLYTPNIARLLLFVISLALGLCLHFFFYFAWATLTFWFGRMWSTLSAMHTVESILGGSLVPLTIVPWLEFSSNFLPFKFMNFVPAFIYLGQYTWTESLLNVIGQVFWLLVFIAIAHIGLTKGLKRYESYGG